MHKIVLYTRVHCHLCEVVKETLDEVRKTDPFELEVIDIDTDPALVEKYGLEVPVVTIDGRKAFKYRMTASALRERLVRSR